MPRIFDNIEQSLLPALKQTLGTSERADFCVGFFNLRGWSKLQGSIDGWVGGESNCCRLLVGMQKLANEELAESLSITHSDNPIDAPTLKRLQRQLAESFRRQLMMGAPNNVDEASLQGLARQIKEKKLVVKLYLRHPLHAKLYLMYRQDFNNPVTGYLGSSNLTLAGLAHQGELNVDVLEQDSCVKLGKWFNDRWDDKWCVDISEELIKIIEESWARPEPLLPYYVYLKMAYHLAQEARTGLDEFKLPAIFQGRLLTFQMNAVKIAAHHINKRGGVLIGDVVGLGKTLMACATAKLLEDDQNLETLIICPKNLVRMWTGYVHRYQLRAKVLPVSVVMNELPDERRYRIVIIDESQNLRNKEGKRYKIIQDYITRNESKCILLSATPYNKSYLDLGAQLQLFVPPDMDLGIRPERYIKEIGEVEFIRRHQALIRSLAAFEKSEYADDWRDLMRLYMVRRTRSFIKDNYAFTDNTNGRKYLAFEDGRRFYFPDRLPVKAVFKFDENDPNDHYARLYSDKVVNIINHMSLPRYGLGSYLTGDALSLASPEEAKQMDNLCKAGGRLIGFCRTNLFKRLESSGQSFLLSVDRHILRNYIYSYAIENSLPLPIGIQGAELLMETIDDEDVDITGATQTGFAFEEEDTNDKGNAIPSDGAHPYTTAWYLDTASKIYEQYSKSKHKRFKWLPPAFFIPSLKKTLLADSQSLIALLQEFGSWDSAQDTKLTALSDLITKTHPQGKILLFTQFADTANYLTNELKKRGVAKLAGVTGESENPTELAWRFSPVSNEKTIKPEEELRVLISTDVLSEGQNLQDCAIVINYDLPWALVRLIQRVGRIDRIGQKAAQIYCYSFLPAEGLEKIIRLRARVKQRLQENSEVVGSDELFFEDDANAQTLRHLYTERSGILDADPDTEVDLSSYAYQIWHNATKDDPELAKKISSLPDVVYATKGHSPTPNSPEGVLVYSKTAEGNDALVWVNKRGESVTQSQTAILKAAECILSTPAQKRNENHHELVRKGLENIIQQDKATGGQLGRPSGARYRSYERLKGYFDDMRKHAPLLATDDLMRAIDDIYKYPLRSLATDALNRQLKTGASDESLANMVIDLRKEGRLSLKEEEIETQEPRIICSMGLFKTEVGGTD